MVKGTGVDIVEVARISSLIEKYGTLFLEKVFTLPEIEWCSRKAFPSGHYAGRWAAKEAFYKALPDCCQPASTWKSIQVLPGDNGKRPVIEICDPRLNALMAGEGIGRYHLSISHEKNYCIALVTLE